MLFLVIFGSLAAAMAIVSQGNLATADAHLKINRSLSAAETGMRWVRYRLDQSAARVLTRDGLIDPGNAPTLWDGVRTDLLTSLSNELHNIEEPVLGGTTLFVGPIAVGPNAPTFTAEITPHPILGEDYNAAYYQRPPYNTMTPAVSAATPLDATWVRVKVVGYDGPANSPITRTIQMDFKLEKKIRFAILSKSRVMIGQNVMIEGPIGSRFIETNLEHGHPVQMVSDFRGLGDALDDSLDALNNTLATNDRDGDNRINLANPSEVQDITDPAQHDKNADGYIDDYDFFLGAFDSNADGRVSTIELSSLPPIVAGQLVELIDTFGDPSRAGYNDGFIDADDRYAKVRGQIMVRADLASWQAGAANGMYQSYFQGPIHPDYQQAPLTFQASDTNVHQFEPADFDVSSFRGMATGDLVSQATTQAAQYDPSDPGSPQPLGSQTREEVPFGAAHPYDYYDRPVYKNMTFTNVTIPKGSNALFVNCKFIGVTFVETDTNNSDPNFNYAGMQAIDGTLMHPDKQATVNGQTVPDTKTVSNNLRFDGCTFEGSIVSDAPPAYTHVRNKISFTGRTRFVIDDSQNLTSEQKAVFKRSTILTPHYSVEMGTFISPSDANETVELSGTIVAGVLDVRGQVKLNGTLLTTFEPLSNTGPVVGETSPQFNTTLGYFGSSSGDLEAEVPATGLGVVQIRYDPTLPLPDGILGPVSVTPVVATYFEGTR